MDDHVTDRRKIAKARSNRAAGRIVRIDLGDGRSAYGRQLTDVTVEFYDRLGEPSEAIDLVELVTAPVAFRIWVMDSAFRRRGDWELLDVVPLSQQEQTEAYRYTKQDPLSGALSIYWTDPVSGAHGETPATIETCEGLERAAVWDPEHIKDRLRDHFDGRPNKWVESIRLKP
jgi:hypothetical protein